MNMVIDTSAQITGTIIIHAITKEEFSIMDIQSNTNNIGRGRIRDVAKQLEQDGWIKKNESSRSECWSAGPLTLQYGDMVNSVECSEGLVPVLPDEKSGWD